MGNGKKQSYCLTVNRTKRTIWQLLTVNINPQKNSRAKSQIKQRSKALAVIYLLFDAVHSLGYCY